ncbi:MAG TPA: HAMP domain-containing sensor histidine kinase [Methylibium sp.]|nr:HAMP domain-containing sensor histidine kinase [Methylibium sp.]
MKTLYLRIYLTVVAVLLLFALVSGWVVQRNIEQERERFRADAGQRMAPWAELLQGALPPPTAPDAEQAVALLEWSERLRLPMALDDGAGRRIATAPQFDRFAREAVEEHGPPGMERRAPVRLQLSDGRWLSIVRPPRPPRPGPGGEGRLLAEPPFLRGAGLVLVLGLLFIAVAAGAYPVVRRLTHRLEALQRGVETFGAGALHHRVDESGRDEVAAVATSFNRAAARVEALLEANRSLLANASHELRSPLARLKMAVAMLDEAVPERRAPLKAEIERNIRELDALVEEVLLASRLDARQPDARAPADAVDLLGLAAEEAVRVGASLDLPGPTEPALPATLKADERLLRRALRNLLENARRYGGDTAPEVRLRRGAGGVELAVCDRGPGVPAAERERIFEPFYRLPGHAEQAGGVGLGLSLVRQIARHHGGSVRCEAREGGGSRFVLSLPVA